jgi:hypothetical protein
MALSKFSLALLILAVVCAIALARPQDEVSLINFISFFYLDFSQGFYHFY